MLAAVVVVLAGCSPAGGGQESPGGAAPVVFTGQLESLHPGSLSPADLGLGDQAFGLRLLHDVCTADPAQNTVLSPASVTQALGLLQAGASGTAATALSTLLHQPAYGPGVVAAQHQRTAQLRSITGLGTSNRLFTRAGTTPRASTLDELRTTFDAQVQALDFAQHPQQSTDTINQAVSDDTHGLIPAIFDQPLDSSTTTVLTNAIFLTAQWSTPFQPAVPGPFTTADGTRTAVATLHSEDASTSAAADGWQSVQLPYSNDQLTAYALLPPAAAAPCTVPTTTTLSTLLAALHDNGGSAATISIPKFHLTRTNELLDTLTHEGLQPDGSYPGFGPGAVSQLVQKVDIAVDEGARPPPPPPASAPPPLHESATATSTSTARSCSWSPTPRPTPRCSWFASPTPAGSTSLPRPTPRRLERRHPARPENHRSEGRRRRHGWIPPP